MKFPLFRTTLGVIILFHVALAPSGGNLFMAYKLVLLYLVIKLLTPTARYLIDLNDSESL